MKKDNEKALDQFLEEEDDVNVEKKHKTKKVQVLDEREGLIERIDKIIVVEKNGKQLLREIY